MTSLDRPLAPECLAPRVAQDAVESIVCDQGFVAHHIDSMNKFWVDDLPSIVTENQACVFEFDGGRQRWVVRFSHLHLERPTYVDAQGITHKLLPHEAINMHQTYAAVQRNTVTVWRQVRMERARRPAAPEDDANDVPQAATAQLVQDGLAAAALSEDKIVVLTKRDQERYYWHTVEEHICRDCKMGEIPVMVGTAPCYLAEGEAPGDRNVAIDPRGYFIVEGQEKVCIPQEKLRYNRVFVFRNTDKAPFRAEVRSMHEFKIRSTSTLNVYVCRTQANDRFEVRLPYLDRTVRVDAILRLLGFTSPEQAALSVATWGLLSGLTASQSLEEMVAALSEEEYAVYRYFLNAQQNNVASKQLNVWALDYVQMTRVVSQMGSVGKDALATDPFEQFRHVHHLMGNEFLSHLGYKHDHETRLRKRRLFAYMLGKLSRAAMGVLPPDDREFYGNKIVETSGWLMSLYYRQLWRHVCRKITNYIHKCHRRGKAPEVAEYIETVTSKKMSENLRYSIATGRWGIKRKRARTHAVVTQQMKRMVHMATLGNLRKINTPMSHKGRNPEPRQLRQSQHGLLCLAKTPEGAPVGLLKNLTLGARVSTGCMSHVLVTAMMNEPGLLDMVETFPGSDFFYQSGGLAATFKDKGFAVPMREHGVKESGTARQWPRDGFKRASHQRVWIEKELLDDQAYLARRSPGDSLFFVNGILMGRVLERNARPMVEALRAMRRRLALPMDTSVAYNPEHKEIYVVCEAGLLRRPVIITDLAI